LRKNTAKLGEREKEEIGKTIEKENYWVGI